MVVLQLFGLLLIVSVQQWHFRIGYPSLPILRQLIPSLDSMPSFECEACHFGKHHRVTFSPFVVVNVELLLSS